MAPSTSTSEFVISQSELTRRVKERAFALGFDCVGVTSADPFDAEAARLSEWIAAGRHGTMRYMADAADARRDPRTLFPGARTIVSVAMNYFTGKRDASDVGPAGGAVARYAWGRDYHAVLRERLTSLLGAIIEMSPGCEGRVSADAVPLFEKAIAERAGIGWIGKHTNLITQSYGSWILLGEILLTIPLDFDEPFAFDYCGTCVRCIEACPTQAITAPYELDATRCISYATIEHRGKIPDAFRGKMEGWLFGCDICQEVCPWNRFEQETSTDDFLPRPGLSGLALEAVAHLTKDEYRDRFAGTALTRARRDGLRRNARFLLEEPT
ncbi:MAG: tRNA epoxyqueuosine(34) reductase QueG [bacterium]